MNREARDPWAGEQMSRSDAQRRYTNLVQYQLRPMLMNYRRMSPDEITAVLKRIVQQAHRFRFESGMVAGGGTREEVVDLLAIYFKPESETAPEVIDWMQRTIRAFGASVASDE